MLIFQLNLTCFTACSGMDSTWSDKQVLSVVLNRTIEVFSSVPSCVSVLLWLSLLGYLLG